MQQQPNNQKKMPLIMEQFILYAAKTTPFYRDLAIKLGIGTTNEKENAKEFNLQQQQKVRSWPTHLWKTLSKNKATNRNKLKMTSYLDQLREQTRLKQRSDMSDQKQPPSGLMDIADVLKDQSKEISEIK